jgi:hypothetical protein
MALRRQATRIPRQPDLAPLENEWERMYHQAVVLVKSGFLPQSIKTPEQAMTIAMTGAELGLPIMLALRSIHVINGRPTLSADLMASLVQREIDRRGDGLLMVTPPTESECTVTFRRWGWKEEQQYRYTLEDAKRAGLLGKDTWKAHPGAMLRARATANVCRMAFPDVIAGLYAPEELAEMPDPGTFAPEQEPPFAAAAGWMDADNDDDIIDADTDDLLPHQRSLTADDPTNGVDMITSHQRGEILWLAGKLGWTLDGTPESDPDADRVDDFCGEITGISSLKNLSAQRASMVIDAMRERLPKVGSRAKGG